MLKVLLVNARKTRTGIFGEAALAETITGMQEPGTKRWESFMHEERAELARLFGHNAFRQRALRTTHRLFKEIGAEGHADRLARDLGQ